MDRSLSLTIRDEEFIFDHRRTIYWPKKKTLIATDLHWGKTQFLRNHGVAISDEVFHADLLRLSEVLRDYRADTLLVLGDLVHHEKALSKGVIEKVAYFRHELPCELILIKGNHDRYTKFPESWGIVEESAFYQGDFSFHHEFMKEDKNYQFTGHLHPMIRLRAGHDMLRVPAFILSDNHCNLPAFSHLTGGVDIKKQPDERAVLVLENGVELI